MDRPEEDPLTEFVDVLNKYSVEFVVVGAHALGWHGLVRGTKDVDILIRPTKENASRVLKALADFGFESLGVTEQDLLSADKVVQLGVAPNRIDLLSELDGVKSEEVWRTRVSGSFRGKPVSYLSEELLIANKLATGREQDRLDVEKLQAQKRLKRRN